MGHGLCGRLALPAVGAEVIPTQYQPLHGKRHSAASRCSRSRKSVGRHAGIAAKLIHLIGGGLDQQQLVPLRRQSQGRLQHQRMGGADGVDPDLFPCLCCATRSSIDFISLFLLA